MHIFAVRHGCAIFFHGAVRGDEIILPIFRCAFFFFLPFRCNNEGDQEGEASGRALPGTVNRGDALMRGKQVQKELLGGKASCFVQTSTSILYTEGV